MNESPVAAADLSALALVGEASAEDRAALARQARRRVLADGDALVEQGERAAELYWVVAGRIALRARHEGRTTLVATLGPGALLGWSALRDDAVWLTSARAVGATEVVAVPAAAILALLAAGGEQSSRLIKVLVRAAANDLDQARLQMLSLGREGVISAG